MPTDGRAAIYSSTFGVGPVATTVIVVAIIIVSLTCHVALFGVTTMPALDLCMRSLT